MVSMRADVIGIGISMPLLAIFAVVLRVNARRIRKTKLGVDDYCSVVAAIFSCALSSLMLVAVYKGNLGSHVEYLKPGVPAHPDQFIEFGKVLWIYVFMTTPATGFAKLSILFFYKRIFTDRKFQLACWVMIGLITAWIIALFFLNLFDCTPLAANWAPGVTGRCINIPQSFWAMVLSDIISDALILSMPSYQIYKLQMSRSRKFQVFSTFLLGAFVVLAGVIRCIFSESSVSEAAKMDVTYQKAPAIYWTVIEACIGVLSCCLPTYRPLIAYYKIDSAFSSVGKSLFSSNRYTKHSDSGDPEQYAGAPSQTELVDAKRGGMYNGRAGLMDNPNSSNRGIMVEKNFATIHETV